MTGRERLLWRMQSGAPWGRRWKSRLSLFGAPATEEKLWRQFQERAGLLRSLISFGRRLLRAMVRRAALLPGGGGILRRIGFDTGGGGLRAGKKPGLRGGGRRLRAAGPAVRPGRKFLITLLNAPLSTAAARRCIESARKCGEDQGLEVMPATDRFQSEDFFIRHGLTFNAAWEKRDNLDRDDPHAIMGCFASHFRLWQRCLELGEPIIVLEHDALFRFRIPPLHFRHVIGLNRPLPGYVDSGPLVPADPEQEGPEVLYPWHRLTDTSAYAIKPEAAHILIEAARRRIVPPVDHHICRKNVDLLYYSSPVLVEHDRRFSFIAPQLTIDGRETQRTGQVQDAGPAPEAEFLRQYLPQ